MKLKTPPAKATRGMNWVVFRMRPVVDGGGLAPVQAAVGRICRKDLDGELVGFDGAILPV
jgi:hypothetical protein